MLVGVQMQHQYLKYVLEGDQQPFPIFICIFDKNPDGNELADA